MIGFNHMFSVNVVVQIYISPHFEMAGFTDFFFDVTHIIFASVLSIFSATLTRKIFFPQLCLNNKITVSHWWNKIKTYILIVNPAFHLEKHSKHVYLKQVGKWDEAGHTVTGHSWLLCGIIRWMFLFSQLPTKKKQQHSKPHYFSHVTFAVKTTITLASRDVIFIYLVLYSVRFVICCRSLIS